ncbi:thiamine phosphate synthase [Herbivorax sp. ANBcel31]|uniref:thiamine phosphate synthase n=1 Tax=Herbivorax sp. ANBcel31 TaxID=3069754 RepID=UPI0027ADE366|nr:thiamine phosphate synthase [Herbivorax sp. ANBcel31]MDQ2085935.1 thiamine phosphate synthase [Herbivorax sp. ANBcel31]
MDEFYRIIDANVNRASEGIRVLEDLARFYYDDKDISKRLKEIRHGIRKEVMDFFPYLLEGRDSIKDVGVDVSKELEIDNKVSIKELMTANFKRLQEALRTIEENLKVIDKYKLSKVYEGFRFDTYQLEKDFFKKIFQQKKRSNLLKGLYCITAHEFSKGRSNIEVVENIIKAGAKIVQYREKDKSFIDMYKECTKIREMTKRAGVTFIINDYVDMAMIVKADGVHLGQDDYPVQKVRNLVGEDMIIGLSTHSPKQAQDAVGQDVDYIGVGPIYKTYTKKNVCDPVGLEYLEYVIKNIDIPYVAIGGIKENNLSEVLCKGAKCISMVTEITEAKDIEEKVKKINRKILEGEM